MEKQDSKGANEPAVRARISGSAVRSLVVGVLGWFSYLLSYHLSFGAILHMPLSLLAVVTGAGALREIRRADGGLRGRRVAISAIVVGGIGIVLTVIILVSHPESRAWEKARKAACASNLKEIGRACRTYADENGGLLPDDLSRLYPEYINTLMAFRCPSANDPPLSPDRIEQNGSYVYVHGVAANDPKDTLLVHDKPTSHHDERYRGRNELYLGGRVEWKPDDTRD